LDYRFVLQLLRELLAEFKIPANPIGYFFVAEAIGVIYKLLLAIACINNVGMTVAPTVNHFPFASIVLSALTFGTLCIEPKSAIKLSSTVNRRFLWLEVVICGTRYFNPTPGANLK
jgi:hypothetical protein